MPIIGPVIRPPSEAESFLLQVTTGCSDNNCTFCGAYKNKNFTVKPLEEIFTDIDIQALSFPDTRKVFLLDGDALAVSNDIILTVLDKLSSSFSCIQKVSSYANGYNIHIRSDSELLELNSRGLRHIYMGLESGSQDILDYCGKKSSSEMMINAVIRTRNAGIKSSVILLLGLGGKEKSMKHVEASITAINRMQPRYLSFLTLMLIPGTQLHDKMRTGEFTPLFPIEYLKEAKDIIEGLDLIGTVFRSNHASNYLALEGRFPKDKKRIISEIEKAINGEIVFRKDDLRLL